MKLKDNMTLQEYVGEMSEGNPGAINVMMCMIGEDNLLGLNAIFWLDDRGVYGPKIWRAYKNTCKSNIKAMIHRSINGTL